MFERYTEKARRVIFFGRYEASQFGCEEIEADFLLLGIARENPELCIRWLGANYAELRESIARLYTRGEPIATNVDLPLSNASKRALAYAAEEADRLRDSHIGTEHLFLGLLREAAGSRVSRRAQIRLVAEDGVEVAVIPWQGHTPRIGEALRLTNSDGGEITYRILDLCWCMEDPLIPGLQDSEFLLKVQREQP